jgi:hypothetical protein
MAMRNWTPEQRQRQRELIQRWKPWEKSTGAKTVRGKSKSSKNAVKNGESVKIRQFIKEVNRLLREHRKLLK